MSSNAPVGPHVPCRSLTALHLTETLRRELDALTIGAREVERLAAHLVRVDAGLSDALPQLCPPLGRDPYRQVVQPTEELAVFTEVEAREIEERQAVAVSQVEEEVRGPGVVAVLEQVGQRELEQPLVEVDRLLDIAAEERDVVDAFGRRRRARLGLVEEALT